MPLPVAAVAVVSWVQMWVAVVAVAVVPAVLVVAMGVMQGLGEALTLALQVGVAAVGVAAATTLHTWVDGAEPLQVVGLEG